MLKAILIISAAVVLVLFAALGAMIVYIFGDEERYEHEERYEYEEKKSDISRAVQGEELQRDNP